MPAGVLAFLVVFFQGDASQISSVPPAVVRPLKLEVLVEEARQDLAKRLSVPVTGVSVEKAQTVVWPNASLGCPEQGMAYADVLTPGYLIVLKTEDREYEYHSSRTGGLTFCKNPTPPVPGAPHDI